MTSPPAASSNPFGDTSARRLLADHVRPQLRYLLYALGFMSVYAATTAGQAWLMEPMLDRVFLEQDHTMLLLVPLAVVVLAFTKAGSDFGQTMALSRVGQRITADLQTRLFDHVIRADLRDFTEHGSGRLISSLTYDTQQLRSAASSALTGIARDALTIFFLIGLMFYQDWRLALIALVGFPLASLPIARLGKRMRKVSRQGQAQMSDLISRLEQTFRGVRQVKADHREDSESNHAASLIERLFALNLKAARVRATTSPIMEVLGGFAVAGVIFYGGTRVFAGATTPGTFFSFVTALLMAYRPLKSLAKLNAQIQEGLAAADRIYAVLDRPPRVQEAPDAKPLVLSRGAIHFEGVTFGYRPDQPAVRDLDLAIPAGRTIALVGPSGAGKSTILNLLLRFYDVDRGRILIDGQDIRNVTFKSLRNAIALVSQDVDLFDDTVEANVAYGRPDATIEAIVRAASDAAADDFIRKLPRGYDTPVGPSGASLSGGQRQRLGIARAMLKDAPILLLDEATSALDSEAEHLIQSALERLKRGRTTLVIAHRLSTIVGADLIVVLDQGRVIETGTHPALLAKRGTYARLYDMQFAHQRKAREPALVSTAGT